MKKLASILISLLLVVSMIAGACADTFMGDDNGIGPVTVTLTVEDGKITDAVVTGEKETPGFGYEPIYEGTYAKQFGEISSIYKDGDKLCRDAKDPITCGMAMEEFVPENYWKENPEAGVFIMGAGGSCISMCSYYMRNSGKGNDPAKIVVCNRSLPRLEECEKINNEFYPNTIPAEYYLTPEPGQNDVQMEKMGKGSLVINATGLGKDRPGSPLTDAALFPKNALVWELNYRGERLFMHQAEAQSESRGVQVIDGWMYFIYGWTQVIADVFHTEILGERLKEMDRIAAKFNKR